jgi:hypothetical protein|tara:strand:- start:175 stop:357 length:183 start_codon:yes stop_codon:yes gene_type:complete
LNRELKESLLSPGALPMPHKHGNAVFASGSMADYSGMNENYFSQSMEQKKMANEFKKQLK